MDYKDRLTYFNSTDKYKKELRFLLGLMNMDCTEVLDYGCGIGTAVNYIYNGFSSYGRDVIVRGVDINKYFEQTPYWLLEGEPVGEYDHITFIHSLAHIKNVDKVLLKLKNNLKDGGWITVITPNKDWIDLVGDTKSDPTVVTHYTGQTLRNLFIEAGYKINQQGQFGALIKDQYERLFIQVEK